jgi:hypothetical protein
MRQTRIYRAFCIHQSHGISKCIVLFNAIFIEIAETHRCATQRSLMGSLPAVPDESLLVGA